MDYIEKLLNISNYRKGSKEFLLDYYNSIANPQNTLKVIHITGTAGKGSTASMIACGLENAGYKVGFFSSPHLLKINERIKINNQEIRDEDLNSYLRYFFKKFPEASFSEYLILSAIKYFLDQKVDYLVMEVFVGGENDLTNIFEQSISVITSIGLDHTQLLGSTKEMILKEKLGILKKEGVLFTRITNPIIDEEIKKKKAKLLKVDSLVDTNMLGDFQRENAGLAQAVLRHLGVAEDIISESLQNIKWSGRLEYIEKNIILDCAHNALGIKRLSEYIKTQKYNKLYYLFALSKNKDIAKFRKYLSDSEVIYTKTKVFKTWNPENFVDKASIIEDSKEAFKYLKKKLGKDDLLIVTGSVFLVSEIMKIYE